MQAIEQYLSRFFPLHPEIADQALFLTDLLAFFEMKPHGRSPNRMRCPRRGRFVHGFEFQECLLRLSGNHAARSRGSSISRSSPASASR